MSVIQKIRDKYAGVVIAFIALSLIAFILMDAFSGRGGSLFGNRDTLGKVNGKKIGKNAFDDQAELFKKAYNMGNASYDQLMNRVWDYNVDNIVLQDEYDELGLAFSAKELNATLFGANPPAWMRQSFTDPNTGEYNAAQAAEYFRQLKAGKVPEGDMVYELYIKQQTIDNTLRQKYISLLANSVYVPKWLAEKQMADANAISSVSYVYVPYNSLPDSNFKATDAEIEKYIKAHPAQFRVEEETRTVSYVPFDVKPSAADSQAVLNQVMQYKNEFATTPDTLQGPFLERVGSEMAYANTYFGGSKIQHAFKDSIINTKPGTVYGPYLDGNMYVLAKLLGVKNWPDSARVRHILIQTQDPQRGVVLMDDSIAKKRIDSIELAIQRGASFDSLARRFSDDGSKDKGGVLTGQNGSEYFSQGDMVPEFNEFVFDHQVGYKGVVKTVYGYHYIEILGQKNFQPAYKIAYLAKSITPSQETVDVAMADAQRFAAESRNQKAYNENLTKYNKTSLQSMDIHKFDATVAGLGENRAFVRWVYENEVGDISEPFDMKDKLIVAMITNIQEEGLMNVAKARPMAEPYVVNEKKARKIIADKFKGNTLEQYSSASGIAINRADSIGFISSFVPGVGMEPKIVGT
ncbi:MAG TPA: peptidylprolyl isomerase, partial [Chitinophagaceae bacterium]